MRAVSLTLAAALALAACAVDDGFRAAPKAGDPGWRAVALETGRWRISFRGAGGPEKALRQALRRAGEVAIEQGYDWVVIVSAQTLPVTSAVHSRDRTDPLDPWPLGGAASPRTHEAAAEVLFVRGAKPDAASVERPSDLITAGARR
jgi:hypothetical protein